MDYARYRRGKGDDNDQAVDRSGCAHDLASSPHAKGHYEYVVCLHDEVRFRDWTEPTNPMLLRRECYPVLPRELPRASLSKFNSI